MNQIASQDLGRTFVSHPLSRSFLVTYFCYILVLIIPATMLASIQYSWPTYHKQLLQPSLSYQAYQLTCLNKDGKLLYNSNFSPNGFFKNHTLTLSAGVSRNRIYIAADVMQLNIVSCNAQIYLKSKLGSSIELISHLPINIAVGSPNQYLKSTRIYGSVSIKSSIPIPQSSLLIINQSQFSTPPTSSSSTYSFSTNFASSADKQVLLTQQIAYKNIEVSRTVNTSTFSFTAQYQILGDMYHVECSLMEKLRVFLPIFMYISMLMWWVGVDPLVDWMFRNGVYSARPLISKFKAD